MTVLEEMQFSRSIDRDFVMLFPLRSSLKFAVCT